MYKRWCLILLALLFLAACRNSPSTPAPLLASTPAPPIPTLDVVQVRQGEPLYNLYCAACHGSNGEGQPNWKTSNSDGSLPAPPHDNNGHTWHHADDLLVELVANGSNFPQSTMPTFDDQLSEDEIRAILEYIKTWWGPEERRFQWQVTWQTQQR